MIIKVINNSRNDIPRYAHDGDSGMDLRANLDHPISLEPNKRVLVPTGIHMQIPRGYEGQVRGRSGLALKNGVTVLQGVGTIDAGFIGDIGVVLINHGEETFQINNGDKIAQLVICPIKNVIIAEVDNLDNTARGQKGYGSTGVDN